MLDDSSIRWAVDFIKNHYDGDLFPNIMEINAISNNLDQFVSLVAGKKDLSEFLPGGCRRFFVPKGERSFRQATQLDPQDSIILTSIIYQYGQNIEDRRLDRNVVYSYRFSPDTNQGLYSMKNAWNDFWNAASINSSKFEYVLYCDIADFYNQIYHHTVENQLIQSNFPNQITKWIIKLLESTTAGVSRGIPVGPHASHLIAEATMIPIDNSLTHQGLKFMRFVDDILIFCNSEKCVKLATSKMASILDKQQRLMIQDQKTKIYNIKEFKNLCKIRIEDRPISSEEDNILNIIKKYSGNNPYRTIFYNSISNEDWNLITEDMINKIIYEYIDQEEIDYIRLRWFYRRLTQIGHPGAIEISLKEISRLEPCFANICTYLASVQLINTDRWKDIGAKLISLLDSDEVQNNEYFKLSILSLFTRNNHINHFTKLINAYQSCAPFARREIILAANQNLAEDWLREQKENYQTMDPWQKMAYIYSISGLPKDEKKYFINKINFDRPFDKVLAKWSKDV